MIKQSRKHLWKRLDEVTLNLKSLLDSAFAFRAVIIINFCIVLLASFKINIEVDGELKYRMFYHSSSLIIASFFSILFAWISRFSALKISEPNDEKRVELGFMFISLACFAWVVSSFMIIWFGLYDVANNVPDRKLQWWISIVTGDINSLFFISVIPYLTFREKPRLIKSLEWLLNRKAIFIIGLFMLFSYSAFSIVLIDEFKAMGDDPDFPFKMKVIKCISLFMTLFAFMIFAVSFNQIFLERVNWARYLLWLAIGMLGWALYLDVEMFFNQSIVPKLIESIVSFAYRPLLLVMFVVFTISSFYETLTMKEKIQSDLYSGFISTLSKTTEIKYLNKILDYVKERLIKSGVLDYYLAVIIGSKQKEKVLVLETEKGSDFIYEKYLEEVPPDSFSGYCLRTGEEVFVQDLYDKHQIAKYGVKVLNKKIAPLSNSLAVIPIIKGKEKTIYGLLTIQSKEKRKFNEEEITMLREVSALIDAFIDEGDEMVGMPPEVKFIRTIANKRNGAKDPYHDYFDQSSNLLKETLAYREAGEYLYGDLAIFIYGKCDLSKTDNLFEMKSNGSAYHQNHPVNRIMKGIAEKKVSCGLILLLGTVVYEREVNKEVNNVIKTLWHEVISEWETSRNSIVSNSIQEQFFRGRKDDNIRNRYYEVTITAIFELFCELMFIEGLRKTSNLLNIEYDITKCSIHFTFGLFNPNDLKQKITNNIELISEGISALNRGLSKKIVVLEYFWLPGGRFKHVIKEEKNQGSITFSFTF